MTTIAWDGKTLAGDSRVSQSGTILPERFCKVVLGSNGHIGGVAGNVDMQCEIFLDWVKKGCEGDPVYPKSDSTFILITPAGTVQELIKGESVTKIKHWGYYAWGSGRDFALGALASGATAIRAVEAAMKFDPITGGKITAYTLQKFQ